MIRKKMITFKVPERTVALILKHCNNVYWGLNSMFEYGSMTVEELHASNDFFREVKEALNIKDDGVYPNNYYRKVK
tara:strand:+ start:887 stop:1114 length:228 start_codon:yes stop_codon:yes gene_type:complete